MSVTRRVTFRLYPTKDQGTKELRLAAATGVEEAPETLASAKRVSVVHSIQSQHQLLLILLG